MLNFYRGCKAAGIACTVAVAFVGCRAHQYGHIVSNDTPDMVGSHAAGAATFKPLIDASMAKLLGRCSQSPIQLASHGEAAAPMRVCFIGVENKSIEELGDFKEQIYQHIDTQLSGAPNFAPISRRFVDAGLLETRLRPDQLFMPTNQRAFAAHMEQAGQPFDYMLYATLTSGSTLNNKSEQRDYLLTMELVNIHTGQYEKESASIRKGYHKTRAGRASTYGITNWWR